MVLGLIGAVVLASGSLLKAIAMIMLGLLLAQINTDVISGIARYSFDIPELTDGIGFVVIAMGVFGFGEIIANLGQPAEHREVFTKQGQGPVADQATTSSDAWPSVLRGTALGSILGVLPGGGALLASFASYTVEKKTDAQPAQCRSARARSSGVAGPESANNAGAQTSFIPMLTLGIPPNAVMALMVGAMTIQDIQPGPQVMTSNPQLFWGLIASMWVGNAMLVDPEPAADRHVDQAADGALPLPVPGDHAVLLHRRLLAQQQHLRRLHDGDLRLHRLRVLQARAASRRRCCSASSSGR